MRHRLFLAAGLLALAFEISAGVVPKPIATQLPVEVVQPQQEIAIDVPTTASTVGMQFGLIGALVGSAIQNSQAQDAEKRVTPVRDALIGYDFNARLEQALRAKMASDAISPEPQFAFLSPAAVAERVAARAEIPAQALVLMPRYAFDYDMETLTVRIDATLENRERKKNGKYKYKPQFKHAYAFSFPITNAAKTAQPWIDQGREGLATILDQGIAQVTDMLAHDFSDAGRLEWDADNRKQSARLKGREFPGTAIRQEADYVWVRTGQFDAQVLQGWQPLDAPIAAPPRAPGATPAGAPAIGIPTVAPDAGTPVAGAAEPQNAAAAAPSTNTEPAPTTDTTPTATDKGD